MAAAALHQGDSNHEIRLEHHTQKARSILSIGRSVVDCFVDFGEDQTSAVRRSDLVRDQTIALEWRTHKRNHDVVTIELRRARYGLAALLGVLSCKPHFCVLCDKRKE